jgi:hypothetical protein
MKTKTFSNKNQGGCADKETEEGGDVKLLYPLPHSGGRRWRLYYIIK